MGNPDNSLLKALTFGMALFASHLFFNFSVSFALNHAMGNPHVRRAQIMIWMEEDHGRRSHYRETSRHSCRRIRAIIERPGKSMQMYQCLHGNAYRFDISGDLPKVHVWTVESFLGYYVEPRVHFSRFGNSSG